MPRHGNHTTAVVRVNNGLSYRFLRFLNLIFRTARKAQQVDAYDGGVRTAYRLDIRPIFVPNPSASILRGMLMAEQCMTLRQLHQAAKQVLCFAGSIPINRTLRLQCEGSQQEQCESMYEFVH